MALDARLPRERGARVLVLMARAARLDHALAARGVSRRQVLVTVVARGRARLFVLMWPMTAQAVLRAVDLDGGEGSLGSCVATPAIPWGEGFEDSLPRPSPTRVGGRRLTSGASLGRGRDPGGLIELAQSLRVLARVESERVTRRAVRLGAVAEALSGSSAGVLDLGLLLVAAGATSGIDSTELGFRVSVAIRAREALSNHVRAVPVHGPSDPPTFPDVDSASRSASSRRRCLVFLGDVGVRPSALCGRAGRGSFRARLEEREHQGKYCAARRRHGADATHKSSFLHFAACVSAGWPRR